jgi:PadR family transcriptional regulator, regulatory protein AphA
VLGIIAMRGPSTPYDLKRMVQLSVGNFWPFPHTQLYDEPKRLAEAGLLEETREESGRRRRHYAITEAGRRPLAEWLSEPVSTPTEYRDLGLLKLFFAELAEPEAVLALAREQAAAQRAQLAGYEAIIARFGSRPELASRVRSAELGIRLARAAAEFWEDVVERESQTDANAA